MARRAYSIPPSPLFVLLIGMVMALWSRLRGTAAGSNSASTPRKTIGVALGLVGVVLVIGVDALRGLGQQTLAQVAVLFGALCTPALHPAAKRLAPSPVVADHRLRNHAVRRSGYCCR